MRERQTKSRTFVKASKKGRRSMLRRYKRGRVGLEGDGAIAPTGGAAALNRYGN
jgi:hypothetical protein